MARSRGAMARPPRRRALVASGALLAVAGPVLATARGAMDDGNQCADDVRELCYGVPDCVNANVRARSRGRAGGALLCLLALGYASRLSFLPPLARSRAIGVHVRGGGGGTPLYACRGAAIKAGSVSIRRRPDLGTAASLRALMVCWACTLALARVRAVCGRTLRRERS